MVSAELKEKMTQLLKDLNVLGDGYTLNDRVVNFWHYSRYSEYFIIKKHTNEIDFIQIYFFENKYLRIKTSEYGINFKGRGNFETKNIAKKLHKQCNNLMIEIDNENAYKI